MIVDMGVLRSYMGASLGEGEDDIACAEDARECPDGSFVSRVAPDCEFADCPGGEVVTVENGLAWHQGNTVILGMDIPNWLLLVAAALGVWMFMRGNK